MSGLSIKVDLGRYRRLVEHSLEQMQKNRVIARIWAKDHTLWKESPTEITNRLGWLDSPRRMTDKISEMQTFVDDVRRDGYTHALLLGMGGSSMAPEVFRKTFGVAPGYLDLAVLDSTDPGAVLGAVEKLDPARTLFIVSTKSGGTVETLSLFKYCYNYTADHLGNTKTGAHFIAITDPASTLAATAEKYHFRKSFLNDPDIGGRYSALTFFGLVPAALIGMDVRWLLEQAQTAAAAETAAAGRPDQEALNGLYLGAVLGELARAGRDKATFIFSPQIESFGAWLEQLIAESLGKEGKGILPVVGDPLGGPADYAPDRVFISIRLQGERQDEAFSALLAAGHPVVQIELTDRYDLGAQCFIWEATTAVVGHLFGVNPFDQPDVEAAKALARQMIVDYVNSGVLPMESPLGAEKGIAVWGNGKTGTLKDNLKEFLGQAQPGGYLALQAFIQPTPDTDAALQALRLRLRDKLKLAVTTGYGPRYLHSTGQLHKGDGGKGLFIQFTASDARDCAIPDEAGKPAAAVTFGTLITAQAFGDGKALVNAGRNVIRFHLGADAVRGLKLLTESL